MEVLNQLELTVRSFFPAHLLQQYDELMASGHPLSKDFPLMNPFHCVLITLFYLISIPVGIQIMKNRPKMNLKWYSAIHNAVLIALSFWMCTTIFIQARILNLPFFAGPIIGVGAEGKELAFALWVFFFSKILEFNDTWIMIMKKNNRQISFLHIYHHSTIFLIWWACVKYAPGADCWWSAMLNSFIHVLMYSHYLSSSFGFPAPWKAFLTMAQMLQFVTNLVQATLNIFNPHDKFPIQLSQMLFFYMISLLTLFGNFFIQDRKREKVAKKDDKPKQQ